MNSEIRMSFDGVTITASFGAGDGIDYSPEILAGKEIANPQGHYVYGHYDERGNLFYIGKGLRLRAWDKERRHVVWHRYVENHLNGKYSVRIILDSMTEDQALNMEAGLITKYGIRLVNWENSGRGFDFKVIEKFHVLRNANRALIESAKAYESAEPNRAIEIYRQAIESSKKYEFLDHEPVGLVGQLIREDKEEIGYSGPLNVMDRLSMLLCKLGRAKEALVEANDYFALYKRDLGLSTGPKIQKRIEKALTK